MEKNILICLEKLDIEGVETAVVNQAMALKEKGCNVFVIAQKGIYSETLKNNGITTIDFKFSIINRIDTENQKIILDIVDKYKINEVHFHQFPCVNYIWSICLTRNIPYVAFIHTLSPEDYEWFMNVFPIYKVILKPYFECASKIIVVTKRGKEIHKKYFPDTDISKYYILPNCISFKMYYSNNKVKEINKFVLLSRFSKEKIEIIKLGIDLFNEYLKLKKDATLDIVGCGAEENTIIEYINQNNIKNVNLIGSTSNVREVLDKYDAVIGIGRCMLEAITMKRIAILIGKNSIKGIIDKSNINEAIECNFAGRLLSDKTKEETARNLYQLNENKIREITDYNYNIIKEKLDISKKVFFLEDIQINNKENEFVKYYIEAINYLLETIEEKERISEEIWNGKLWLEEQLEIHKENNNIKNNNLASKLKKVFKRNK